MDQQADMTLPKSPADPHVFVDAINMTERLAIRDDNVLGDFCGFLDFEGNETDDVEYAEYVIIDWRDGGFTPLALADYKRRTN